MKDVEANNNEYISSDHTIANSECHWHDELKPTDPEPVMIVAYSGFSTTADPTADAEAAALDAPEVARTVACSRRMRSRNNVTSRIASSSLLPCKSNTKFLEFSMICYWNAWDIVLIMIDFNLTPGVSDLSCDRGCAV